MNNGLGFGRVARCSVVREAIGLLLDEWEGVEPGYGTFCPR